jgi:hypothetical protein
LNPNTDQEIIRAIKTLYLRWESQETLMNRPREPDTTRQLTLASRDAVRRGFDFLCSAICEPQAFEQYGFDYLFSLLTSLNSRDFVIRRQAQDVGHTLSLKWVDQHPCVPPGADADTITELVFGSLSASCFGVTNSLKPSILAAAPNFSARAYSWFDPAIEPPPNDVPEVCECGAENDRGDTSCRSCGDMLAMRSRYEVWLLAMIRGYLGDRYGVRLGTTYSDVMKWVAYMRPYPAAHDKADFRWSIYAITHIVYTLNDYNSCWLDRCSLPEEFDVLRNSLDAFIEMDDPETVGEILDSLKSFRVKSSSPLMQRGIRFLLDCQNADGSWGESNVDEVYDWHHVTLAALNGLDEYAFANLAPRPKSVIY